MPEQKKYLSRKEQVKLKPAPEDVIPILLDGDMQKNALDFVAHLRANGLKISWNSRNGWAVSHEGKALCGMAVCDAGFSGKREGWWIDVGLTHFSEYEASIMNQGLQVFIRDNLTSCKFCRPRGACSRQRSMAILGKETDLCGGAAVHVCDPNEAAIELIKRLLELEQTARNEENPERKTQ